MKKGRILTLSSLAFVFVSESLMAEMPSENIHAKREFERLLENIRLKGNKEQLNKHLLDAETFMESRRVDIHGRDSYSGLSYLDAETLRGNLPAVKLLVQNGALRLAHYEQTLNYALSGGSEVLKFLIKEFKINFSKPKYRLTGAQLLREAVTRGDLKVIKELVKKGVPPERGLALAKKRLVNMYNVNSSGNTTRRRDRERWVSIVDFLNQEALGKACGEEFKLY